MGGGTAAWCAGAQGQIIYILRTKIILSDDQEFGALYNAGGHAEHIAVFWHLVTSLPSEAREGLAFDENGA
jgi:hypothetical protein